MALAVMALTFLAFGPTLHNTEFVNYDDHYNFVDNPRYRGLSGAHLRYMFTDTFGNYMPLTWVTHAIDYELWGMQAWGYHLDSLLIHLLNAGLVFWLLLLLLERARPGPGVAAAAALGALFFSVHPLRVEVVAWATERRNVLASTFYLFAVIAYLKGIEDRRWYWGAVASHALSLLSMAWAVTLPAVLVLLDYYPLRRFDWRDKLPFALLAIPAAIVAPIAQHNALAMHTLAQHDLLQRTAQACYGLCFYLAKTVAPVKLCAMYELEQSVSLTQPRYVASMLAVGVLLGLLVAYRRRWPAGLVAFGCYAAIVSPVLGFFQSGPHRVADRYSYLSCVPVAVLLAGGLVLVWRRKPIGLLLTVALLGGLGALTVRQCRVWRTSVSLWQQALRVGPRSTVAHTNLADAYDKAGQLERAIAHYREALKLRPDYVVPRENLPVLLERAGRDGEAIAAYGAAIAAGSFDYGKLYYNRAVLRQRQGDHAGALADYLEAAEHDPKRWRAWFLAGVYLFRARKDDEARAALEKALPLATPEIQRKIHRILERLSR